jgi:hypothetical protein
VTDSAGAAIVNATVLFTGGQLRQNVNVQTDSNGVYDSNWISVGNYSITISASGHSSQSVPAAVNTGLTTTVNVQLD